MKILMVSMTYLPSANGVAVSISNLKKDLGKLGHEVWVLAPENPKAKEEENVVRYPSIPNPVVKDYPVPFLPINRKVIDLLTKEKFDIVHAHHPYYISLFADMVSSLNKIPFVFTHHTRYDEYVKSALKFLPKKLLNEISKYPARTVCKNADLIIAPSKAIKKTLKNKKINTPIKVVPTGLSKFKKVTLSKKELRKKHNIAADKKVLLCVSRIGEEKNTKLLLETLKKIPDEYFLLLVGTGPQERELLKYSNVSGLTKRVRFAGKISHEDVSEFYLLSDVFVFPSLTETQGLVLMEAIYFGLPIATVDSEVNREWVNSSIGYISKNQPNSFKNAILKADKLDRETIKKESKILANKYSSEEIARKMEKLYENAILKGKKKASIKQRLKERFEKIENYIDKVLAE